MLKYVLAAALAVCSVLLPAHAEPIHKRGEFGEWTIYCTEQVATADACSVVTATESEENDKVWVKIGLYYDNDSPRKLRLVFRASPESRAREKLHFSTYKKVPDPTIHSRLPRMKWKQMGLMNLPQDCTVEYCRAEYALGEKIEQQFLDAESLLVLVAFFNERNESIGFYFSIPHLKLALEELRKIALK